MGGDMSEGHEEESSRFPPGFRFTPTDTELIEYYLLPRLQGRSTVPNPAIIDDYAYRCHPDDLLLNGEYKKRGHDDTWYFLSSRARKYANGDRPSRCTDDGRGRWKVSTGCTEAVTPDNVKYCYSSLKYWEGPSYKDEDKGEWLMREITLPDYENKLDGSSKKRKTLDEYVVCKIYLTPKGKKNKNKVDEAGPSGTSEETCPAASLPGPVETTGQETAKPKISKRQKRKRPVDVATPKQAPPAPPPPDRCLGPQAGGPSRPTQPLYGGGGVQARFGTTGYHPHYGGTGRPPMPYNPHASMPPRPPVAFTGHQVAGCRSAPVASPCNSGQTMKMPHLCPAGQSFRPPRPPAVPNYPVTQRQPETEEMRQIRVYQQHVNELMRMHAMRQQQQHQPGNVAYLPAQQPRPMAFMHQQQPPYFGAGFNHQYVRPMPPQFLPYNYHQPVDVGQQVQSSSAVPQFGAATTTPAETDAGSVGATFEGTDVKNDEERLCGGFEKEGAAARKNSSG